MLSQKLKKPEHDEEFEQDRTPVRWTLANGVVFLKDVV